MNIAKNMESIFVAALVVAVSVSNVFAEPAPRALEIAKASVVEAPAPVATVVVVAKRLSAAEKAKRAA